MLQDTYDKIVLAQFPDAMNMRDASVQFLGRLKNEFGFVISSTLMAESVCADEINHRNKVFFHVLGDPFEMGGLAGIPFTGTVGLKAYAHHIPDHGYGLIFFGAHIGITTQGKFGEVCRHGRHKAGTSCGALMIVLSYFRSGETLPADYTNDPQILQLFQWLEPLKQRILQAENPEIEITNCTYEIIRAKTFNAFDVARSEFHVRKIALLGGIIINTEKGADDYFVLRDFEVREIGG